MASSAAVWNECCDDCCSHLLDLVNVDWCVLRLQPSTARPISSCQSTWIDIV